MNPLRKLRGLWLVVVVCPVFVWMQPDWATMGFPGAPTLTYNNQLVVPNGLLMINTATGSGKALPGASLTPTGNVITPTLGNYPNATVITGGNTTVTPTAAPVNAARLSVATSTSFKGTLTINPTTGTITVTNAHMAGLYSVTVTAFNTDDTATKTFVLTVTNPAS